MARRSWTITQLKEAVKKSRSYRQVLNQLDLKEAGGNYAQVKKYIEEYNLNINHFKGRAWNKGLSGIGKPRLSLKEILVKKSNYQSYKLKKRLFKEDLKPRHCEMCGWSEKSVDGRLPLELDHINGDHYDNRLENLRILCPNCHSLQPHYRGVNRKNKKKPGWRNRNTQEA
jgi:hypothetical protein